MEFSEAFSPTRAISHGIAGLKLAPAPLLVGGFLMWLCSGGCGSGGSGNLGDLGKDQPPEVTAAVLVVMLTMLGIALVVGFFAFLFTSFLQTGYVRLHREVLQGRPDSFGTLFSGGDTFGRMAAWKLLSGFIGFGTTIVAAIPGGTILGLAIARDMGTPMVAVGVILLFVIMLPATLYVSLGLSLGTYAVALEGLGATDALDRSWELARGNRLTLFVFYLVTGLFSLLGTILCCIGVFVTRTIADVGTTEAYLLATVPESRGWEIPRLP